jgi:MFS family permease
VPLSAYIGRRPVFIFTSFIFFATVLWCAGAKNFHSLVAARIIGGFVSATTEALMEVIVADIFFLHERGWWMGFALFFLTNGAIVSIGSGFLITTHGWRWLFWVFNLAR